MSINKFALSLALAGILGASSAVAETEGAFVGGYIAEIGLKVEVESQQFRYINGSATTTGSKLGILGGYNRNISNDKRLGLRYYGAADIGDYTTNISANVDMLYTFVNNQTGEIRGFGGAWLGYTSYDGDVSGFDLGINIGARFIFSKKHGVETYGHFGFLSQSKDESFLGVTTTTKYSQPYQIGIRYTYSF